MKRYTSSFYLFWFELINIIYMLPLVFFFFKLFCFFNFPKEVMIWWLVETSLFSKMHFKVRHYEFQIKLSACEVIWREMCYNHPLPLTPTPPAQA